MHRSEVINQIISTKKFSTYLEIGVRRPADCYDLIRCEEKSGVDPGLENPENPVKYPFTSDEFFSKLENNLLDLPPDYKWDLIFIDGLHLSYQVEKDILNSLNHLTESGVIVLHDCDPFMYEENYIRVIEDYWGQAWNGTVWKTIYKLKATRSDLNICTVNTDEGVGLIKRGSQELVPFDNPYFEYKIFQQNRARDLNLIAPDGIKDWLVKELPEKNIDVKFSKFNDHPLDFLFQYFDKNNNRLIHKWEHYFPIYEKHFSRFRNKSPKILEIGVFQGGSLQMWKNYFGEGCQIFGLDIDPRCKDFEEENIKILIGSQSDRLFLKTLKEQIGYVDILIDDGGHTTEQQITSYEELFDLVKENGVYFCEDTHTSYWPDWGGGYKKSGTFIEYSKNFVDQINSEHCSEIGFRKFSDSVESISFYDSIVAIEKKPKKPLVVRMTGKSSW